ncbi:MAG: cytidylate kinase [Gammaproteobacteria bacterium]|jgi:cytidylate kinase
MSKLSLDIITIDGPSGSGKGSAASIIARSLDYKLLDSGAIYRLAALNALNRSIDLSNEIAVASSLTELDISFKSGEHLAIPFLDSKDVSAEIRSENAGDAASIIAQYSTVREGLLNRQRAFLEPPGLVADGRDMGTVVFPSARFKFFLLASVEIRAERRHKQLISMGISDTIAKLQAEIADRDERDRKRSVSPTIPAEDAITIDSSLMTLDEVTNLMLSHIQESR